MGAIAKRSWSKIWDKRTATPSGPGLRDYLEDYTTRMPDGPLRELPTLDTMIAAICDTNNSASGPDGIPFAYYRLCAEEIAPVLLRILKLLATGIKPPEGFNYGSLFLIPKDDSLLIDHTRPISVANADNRIIAKLLANLLGLELNKILHASQKGFIPGRCGLEHIHDLTASFYGAVEEGDQRYVLFLDTKKAFDSVDHRFVHKMLKKIGLPGWMRNTIHGLMTNVKVRPVFATKAEHDISILRVVKQGCPLSPLLFALCYDMLLQQLAKKDDHDAYAFADDLALDAASIRPIISALRTIQKFADFSGLGLNLDKTVVIAARKPTRQTMGRLHLQFPGIKVVAEAKYLGVLVGPEVTTIRIFQGAVDKFYARAGQLQQIIRGSTLNQRILIYNIYLLPILFYLAQFYIIPYIEMVRPIMNHCRRDIAAFNGGIAYCHLINTPRTSFGPHTPLRDLWATNTALLASRSPMILDSNGYDVPQTGDFAHVMAYDWNTLIIAEHEAYSAWLFLYDHGPRDRANNLHTDYIKGAPSTQRRQLYRQLVYYGYWQKRDVDSRSFPTSLPNKLRRFFPYRSTERLRSKVEHLQTNLTLAGTIPRSNQWNTFFRFITNVLPSDRRMTKVGINSTNRNSLRP
jgi:hypothetical protein